MLRFARDVVYCNINDLDENITIKDLEENGLTVKDNLVYIKAGTKFETTKAFGAPAIVLNDDFVLTFTSDTPIEVYFE